MSRQVSENIGTKVLFENDRIKVWEMRLAPGQESELHEHRNDYAMIQISGDRIAARFEPESGGTWGGADVVEGDVQNGLVIFAEKGGIETAVNIGDETFYEIIVELKG
jgi:hypothetical protein